MKIRGLSKDFLDAMRHGLYRGRVKGYRGWDNKWDGSLFPYAPNKFMIDRLHQELDELIIALHDGDPKKILGEASDVANFAMMIADMNQIEEK